MLYSSQELKYFPTKRHKGLAEGCFFDKEYQHKFQHSRLFPGLTVTKATRQTTKTLEAKIQHCTTL